MGLEFLKGGSIMTSPILDDASVALVKAANLQISLASIEEIVGDEDTSESFYEGHYRHPEWPGGASGVTIALGYDLGYTTTAKLDADFKGKIPDQMLAVMHGCVGITGGAAYSKMVAVRSSIDIPWSVALDVFLHRDIPLWIATCQNYLPNFDLLSPDCKGVLVSIAYNRGPSFNAQGDRYREMRQIKTDMISKNFANVSTQIRSMARLWPVSNGVHWRRFREAALWDQGMKPAPVLTS
jgi:hypothetical protein